MTGTPKEKPLSPNWPVDLELIGTPNVGLSLASFLPNTGKVLPELTLGSFALEPNEKEGAAALTLPAPPVGLWEALAFAVVFVTGNKGLLRPEKFGNNEFGVSADGFPKSNLAIAGLSADANEKVEVSLPPPNGAPKTNGLRFASEKSISVDFDGNFESVASLGVDAESTYATTSAS